MNRHFCPRPSQRNNKTGATDVQPTKPRKNKPLYEVVWLPGTKRHKETDVFCIRFTEATEKDSVYYLLLDEFGGNLAFVSNWMYWYEVLLRDRLTWGEVVDMVDEAFKGKLP